MNLNKVYSLNSKENKEYNRIKKGTPADVSLFWEERIIGLLMNGEINEEVAFYTLTLSTLNKADEAREIIRIVSEEAAK